MLKLLDSKKVVSTIDIPKGKIVLKFKGKILSSKDVEFPDCSYISSCYASRVKFTDPYLQIGPNSFIGESGQIDDHISHSCEPNCGIIIRNGKAFLISIKKISKDEEITFDYSTTQTFPKERRSFILVCKCNKLNCRFIIGNISTLQFSQLCYYLMNRVLPFYALKFWIISWILRY